jgi:molecular chaperone GrpE (heat shock protein)
MMGVGTASSTGTLVAVLSAVASFGGFLAYLYFVQRSNANAAREEALALAETRRQVIADLRARLASSDRRRKRLKADYEKRIRKLEAAVERAQTEAREQAYQMQRLYAIGLADVLEGARRDLEAVPPNVESALQRILELLESSRPAA